jgi:beta-lactam-binding protein with PASTA domain
MRRLLRIAFRLLVLVVVFMASALTAMRFAIHGRQTTVPKLVGLSAHDAGRKIDSAGLLLDSSDHFYSSDVPEGRILSQVPEPGEQVRRGWRVRVAESLGPQRVVIPDLKGDSQRAAEMNVRRRGLELGSVAEGSIPDTLPDQIVAQSPPANATNVSAPKVSFLVAAQAERPSFVMPDLTGRPVDDATDTIVRAGLRVGNITTRDTQTDNAGESVAYGTRMVTKTIPAAGQRIYEGQAISLEVTR